MKPLDPYIDPVCGRIVAVNETTPKEDCCRLFQPVFFCSQRCRDEFLKSEDLMSKICHD